LKFNQKQDITLFDPSKAYTTHLLRFVFSHADDADLPCGRNDEKIKTWNDENIKGDSM